MNQEKKIGIIGYGNQARAWIKNLRDSGWDVTCFARRPDSISAKGFRVRKISELKSEDTPFILALLIPDSEHEKFLKINQLKPATVILYAHGYSCHYCELESKFSKYTHELLAPKAIARTLREFYKSKNPIGGAVLKSSKNIGLINTIAIDLGITKIALTSFKEECHADLFSEQSLLCTSLIKQIEASFLFMKSKGIDPDLAFMETFMEAKFILDTLFEVGPQKFFEKISPHALLGAYKNINASQQEGYFDAIWYGINSGEFEAWFQNQNQKQIRESMSNYWKSSDLEKTFKEFFKNETDNNQIY